MNQIDFENEVFKGKFTGKTFRRLFSLTVKYWPLLIGFFASITLTSVLDSCGAYISKFMIDYGVIPQDQGKIIEYGTIWFGLFIANSANFFIFLYCAGRLGEHIQYDLRKNLFNHLQGLSFSFFDKVSSGWLLSRITSDTRRIADLMTWMFLNLIWGVTSISVALIFMFILNWRLALLVGLIIPLLVIASTFFKNKIKKEYRKVRSINSRITQSYAENIAGIKIVKSMTREKQNLKKFGEITDEMHVSSFRAAWLSAIFLPLVQMITTFGMTAILLAGGWELTQPLGSELTVGTLRAFIGYLSFMMWPVQELARVFSEMQQSLVSSERAFSLLDTTAHIQDKPGAKTNAEFKGAVEFRNVSFCYKDDEQILSGFNLRAAPGEIIALVGPTGGGKSTIVNLAARFYQPCKGNIYYDGTDYTEYTQEALQHRIGVVLQQPHLFSGTIKENLLYGKPDAAAEEIQKAVEMACASRLINSLPKKYDEQVGEGGELLSIGQKQLLTLARVFLADPDIIIMDEATSAIDTLTEHEIQKGMSHLLHGRTSFVIAHRLSTIREADRIIVVDNGRIREEGNHKQLLKQKGYYYNLYTNQIKKERQAELGLLG